MQLNKKEFKSLLTKIIMANNTSKFTGIDVYIKFSRKEIQLLKKIKKQL